VARRRTSLGRLLPRPAALLGTRDADRAQPDPAPPPARDDLVPPAHEPRLGVGTEQQGRSYLCPRSRDALLPPPLAPRNRHQLAEPPPVAVIIVHGRVAGRQPLSPTGASAGARCAEARSGSRPRGTQDDSIPRPPGAVDDRGAEAHRRLADLGLGRRARPPRVRARWQRAPAARVEREAAALDGSARPLRSCVSNPDDGRRTCSGERFGRGESLADWSRRPRAERGGGRTTCARAARSRRPRGSWIGDRRDEHVHARTLGARLAADRAGLHRVTDGAHVRRQQQPERVRLRPGAARRCGTHRRSPRARRSRARPSRRRSRTRRRARTGDDPNRPHSSTSFDGRTSTR
jgi:hypothetical protein